VANNQFDFGELEQGIYGPRGGKVLGIASKHSLQRTAFWVEIDKLNPGNYYFKFNADKKCEVSAGKLLEEYSQWSDGIDWVAKPQKEQPQPKSKNSPPKIPTPQIMETKLQYKFKEWDKTIKPAPEVKVQSPKPAPIASNQQRSEVFPRVAVPITFNKPDMRQDSWLLPQQLGPVDMGSTFRQQIIIPRPQISQERPVAVSQTAVNISSPQHFPAVTTTIQRVLRPTSNAARIFESNMPSSPKDQHSNILTQRGGFFSGGTAHPLQFVQGQASMPILPQAIGEYTLVTPRRMGQPVPQPEEGRGKPSGSQLGLADHPMVRMPTAPMAEYNYTLTCGPFTLDRAGILKLDYGYALQTVFACLPVSAKTYSFRGTQVHKFDAPVSEMVESHVLSQAHSKDIALVIKHFSVAEGEMSTEGRKLSPDKVGHSAEGSANYDMSDGNVGCSPKFKYLLIKVGLDDNLHSTDFEDLTQHEIHMLVAFFNVKFGILDRSDKLHEKDPIDKIVLTANRHLQNVMQRTMNFKKNEEFLKKKWKEFLKFCKYKVREQWDLANLSNKMEIAKMVYEEFHRPIVKAKIKQYNGDIRAYQKEEWGATDPGTLETDEPRSDFTDYDSTELAFIKQFFSIKASGEPLRVTKSIYNPETLPEKYQQNLLLSEGFRKLFIVYLCHAQYGISHPIDKLINRLWGKGFQSGISYLEKKNYTDGPEVEIKGPRKLFWTINENLLSNRIVLEKIYKNIGKC